ncbi:hypothetical protein FA13DRAFT_318825 [Coprinellus micaceus]|uniref:Uncharacterized protein n=1 Tax=Coprinellus micaceus TaxID=71717 RepID=A0A4Y7TEL1_COPMI|nr:hypothetical protein FA13DRAFT_318825 [Coprinellus micaceus]
MRRLDGNRPDLMRPYSLHLPSLDESSNTDAAPRSRYGSLRWHNSNTPSRPSSASYHQDPFASNEWSWSATSKRDSVQSSRSSLLPQPRRFSNSIAPTRTIESSMSSPSVLASPNSSIDTQSRIPVPVQRRGTNQNKNFYVVGRKPVHDPGIEVAPRPPPATQANESPTPSPGTISAKAFRRSVASAHSIMQLDANASTLSFHSTASGGVGVRPRSKSHSSQIPQAKGKARRVVSDSAATALGGDGAEETESELPYYISMPAYDGIQQQHPPWLDRANDQGTPSISDFGEAGSFFREIMDSRDDGERDGEPQQGPGTRLCSRLIEELGSQDSGHNQITQASRASVGATNVCDTEPAVLLQAMANETQRMLDERYGVLPESSALPIPPSPLELDLTRANTTKSGTSTVPQPKRVPPPAIPSPLLTPKPKISQSSMSQVSSPQSSNFVRISRRTPSSSPLSHQGNGVSKKHKAKQPSLLGRLFSPTRPKSTPVSQPLRAAPRPAWITGTFVIDPTLRVPGGILSVSSMLSPTRNSAYMGNMGAGAGGEKKNLVLEVQNGGIDVTVKLVSQACGEKGDVVLTKIELTLLGVSSPARGGLDRDAKDRRTRKNGKGCEEEGKDEVYPIVARIVSTVLGNFRCEILYTDEVGPRTLPTPALRSISLRARWHHLQSSTPKSTLPLVSWIRKTMFSSRLRSPRQPLLDKPNAPSPAHTQTLLQRAPKGRTSALREALRENSPHLKLELRSRAVCQGAQRRARD